MGESNGGMWMERRMTHPHALTDARCVDLHRDAVLFQCVFWADAGYHEHLRRAELQLYQHIALGAAGEVNIPLLLKE